MYEYNELNNALAEFFNTGVHRFNNGDDIVGMEGIKRINKMLISVNLPVIPSNISPRSIGEALSGKGVNPLTLGQNVVIANGGNLKQTDDTGTTLGQRLDIIQRETSTPADAVYFDFTRDLDWPDGYTTFREGTSCWWSNDNGRNRYRDSVSLGGQYGNGFCLRLYWPMDEVPPRLEDRKSNTRNRWYDGQYFDRGRVWVIPVAYGYVVFNAYDREGIYRNAQYGELMSNLLNRAFGERAWKHRQIELGAVNGMYINGGSANYVYHSDNEHKIGSVSLTRIVPQMGSTLSCRGCGKRFPQAFWTEDSYKQYPKVMCQDCGEVHEEEVQEKSDIPLRVPNNEVVNDAIHIFGWLNPYESADYECVITGNEGNDRTMIDVSGVEMITEDGTYTRNVWREGTMIDIGIFNYYYQFDVDNNGNEIIRRRLQSEEIVPRQALSQIIYGDVGALKKLYGKLAGKIQRGLTVEPRKATNIYTFPKVQAIRMRLAKRNQLWNDLSWESLL
jgi:hypothetical protein